MSVLDRKVRRDILNTRSTLAAILLVIIVGIACFVGLASSYANLSRSQREYYAQCRMADFSIELKRAPISEIERLATWAGVVEIRDRIVFDATVDLDGVERPLNARIITMPAEPKPVIDDIVLRQGSYFSNEDDSEVIVNESFAEKRGIRPGDSVRVILNDKLHELRVVGTALSSEFVYLIGPGSIVPEPANYGIFYVKRRFAEEITDYNGACNQIVGLLTPENRERPDPILERMERFLEPYGVFATTPRSRQSSHRFLSDEIRGLRVSAVVMPAIFLAIASLILNILMVRMTEQQRVVIGTLKAIGYSNTRVSLHYLKFGGAVGFAGGVAGSMVGYALAEGMTRIYRGFFSFPQLENRLSLPIMLSAMAIAVGIAALGVFRGVRKAAVLSPAEAMRARPPVIGKTVLLERFRDLWNAIGFRWRMVIRSLSRHKRRTAVSVFAAAMGSAIILVAMTLNHSMEALIEFQFDKVLTSDIDLVLRDDLTMSAMYEAQRLPGVDRVEPVLTVPCTFEFGYRKRQGGITGIMPDATMTVPRNADGERVPVPESGLIVSRKLAELLGVGEGGILTVHPVRGRREPIEISVARINEDYLGLSCYADFHDLNRRMNHTEAVSMLQLEIRNDPTARAQLYRELKTIPKVQAVNDIRDSRRNLESTLQESMKVSLVALILFAGAIYLGSILTTSLVSLNERRREVATLIVIGYDWNHVSGVFLRESMLVNVAGALLGLPLGYALCVAVIRAYDTEVYRMPLVLGSAAFVAAIACSIVFTFLAHLMVRRSIVRLNWREALNAKE